MKDLLRQALNLKDILDDFSFMAQITSLSAPRSFATTSAVYLQDFIEKGVVNNSCREALLDRHVVYTYDQVELLYKVKADTSYLRRILTHLLTNAAKHSPSETTIDIGLSSYDVAPNVASSISTSSSSSPASPSLEGLKTFTFRVTNHVLPDFNLIEVTNTLKNPLSFYQDYIRANQGGASPAKDGTRPCSRNGKGNGATLSSAHGLGFGLSVACHMVRGLGGELTCQFEESTRIVSFTFGVPMQQLGLLFELHEEEERLAAAKVSTQPSAPPSSSSASINKACRRLSKCSGRVLVVDDSPVCRKLLSSRLNDAGTLIRTSPILTQ